MNWKVMFGYCVCCRMGGIDATKCLVYIVAGFLLSASKESSVCCVISSLTLNAILELSFCTVSLQQFLWQRHLNHIHSFIHAERHLDVDWWWYCCCDRVPSVCQHRASMHTSWRSWSASRCTVTRHFHSLTSSTTCSESAGRHRGLLRTVAICFSHSWTEKTSVGFLYLILITDLTVMPVAWSIVDRRMWWWTHFADRQTVCFWFICVDWFLVMARYSHKRTR